MTWSSSTITVGAHRFMCNSNESDYNASSLYSGICLFVCCGVTKCECLCVWYVMLEGCSVHVTWFSSWNITFCGSPLCTYLWHWLWWWNNAHVLSVHCTDWTNQHILRIHLSIDNTTHTDIHTWWHHNTQTNKGPIISCRHCNRSHLSYRWNGVLQRWLCPMITS